MNLILQLQSSRRYKEIYCFIQLSGRLYKPKENVVALGPLICGASFSLKAIIGYRYFFLTNDYYL